MRTPFGLLVIITSSTIFFGCARKQMQDLSLAVPKGYPKATKIVSGNWEDQIKQKFALGDAAQSELNRIPFRSAADAPKTMLVQKPAAAKKTGSTWFSPLALAKYLPASLKAKTGSAAKKASEKPVVKLAARTPKHRTLSSKNSHKHPQTHLIAGR